jgi:MFS family permease
MDARWAVTAAFAATGTTIASFAVRTPSLKLEHGLGDGWVGLVSALFGVAALSTMRLAGRLASRVGSGPVLRAALAALPVALAGVGAAGGRPALVVAVLVLGAVNGAVDVTMNAHAVAVERELGRPVLSGCHAAWSIGAVAGSLAGGAAAGAGASLWLHWAVVAGVLVPPALVAGRGLLPASADRAAPGGEVPAGGPRRRRGGWSWRIVALGLMGAAVMTCEASVVNWSGLLLHEHRGATLGVAALGLAAFSGCQTLGRLAGDRLIARRPAHELVRRGAAAGAAGLALAVLSPSPWAAVAGFAVLGIGLATPLPVLFGVVGRLGTPSEAAVRVSTFTTLTYAGILLAPPLIGWTAERAGLVPTLSALAVLLAAVAVAAPRVVPATRTPEGVPA